MSKKTNDKRFNKILPSHTDYRLNVAFQYEPMIFNTTSARNESLKSTYI